MRADLVEQFFEVDVQEEGGCIYGSRSLLFVDAHWQRVRLPTRSNRPRLPPIKLRLHR